MKATTFRMNLQTFILTYTDGDGEPTPANDGSLLYRGWIPNADLLLPPPGFEEVEAWCNGFRTVWKSDADRALICCCEGDVSVTVHLSESTYQAELHRCAAFYAALGQASPAQPAETPVTGPSSERLQPSDGGMDDPPERCSR